MTQKIEVDFGLCESNGVCMGIIPEVFDLDDEDYLHVLQDEVTPENEQQVKEAVRQCPRQAICDQATNDHIRSSSSTRSPRSSSTARGRSTGACAKKRRCTTTPSTTSTRCRATKTSQRRTRTSRHTRRRTDWTWRRCGPNEPMTAKMIILMDPPEHRQMRSLVNKVFTPRAIEAMRPMVTETIDRYLAKADPERFDVVQDFSAFFPVEVITQMLGVPEEYRQQVGEWVDVVPASRTRSDRHVRKGHASRSAEAMGLYYSIIQERRADPQDDMFSRLDRRRDRARRRREGDARRLRDRRLRNASWAARARRPSPSWSATRR